MLKVYHASLTPNIEKFLPLSHFGERDCALAAVAAKYFTEANLSARKDAWIYEIELDVTEEDLLDSQDVGFPEARAILYRLRTCFGNKKDYFQGAFEAMKLFVSNGVSDDVAEKVALDFIIEFMARDSKSVIRYKNEVEAEGSISYCIPDCSHLNVGVPIRLSMDELRRGYSLLSTSRPSQLLHPDQWFERVAGS